MTSHHLWWVRSGVSCVVLKYHRTNSTQDIIYSMTDLQRVALKGSGPSQMDAFMMLWNRFLLMITERNRPNQASPRPQGPGGGSGRWRALLTAPSALTHH